VSCAKSLGEGAGLRKGMRCAMEEKLLLPAAVARHEEEEGCGG
jgi:hypothetical protein